MSYNNSQQSIYSQALSSPSGAHYNTPHHGGSQYAGSGQQWPPQQHIAGTPTPTPAHTPPAAPMSGGGQFPAHHLPHRQWQPQGPACNSAQGPPGYYSRGPLPQHAHMGSPWAKTNQGGAGGSPLFSLQMLVNQDINRSGSVAPVIQEGVDLTSDSYSRPLPLTHRMPVNGDKETVSVIAQTPPKKQAVLSVPSPMTELEDPSLSSPNRGRMADDSSVMMVDSAAGLALSANKPTEDGLTAPVSSPPLAAKDSTSPVRSPKSGAIKRMRKVDSILENLVECGSKKIASNASEQPPQVPASTVVVAPASVIVSPTVVNEDSGGGCTGHEAQTLSPGLLNMGTNKSDTQSREEAVSPSFNSVDDENGKPRRKRKLDKPIRMAKTSSDTDSAKTSSCESMASVQTDDEVCSKVEDTKAESTPAVCCNVKSEPELVKDHVFEKSYDKNSNTLRQEDIISVESKETIEQTKLDENCVSSPPSPKATASEVLQIKVENDTKSEDLLSALASEGRDKLEETKSETNNPFMEVETELEKMFAGIVENEPTADTVKLEENSNSVKEESPAVKELDCLSTSEAAMLDAKPLANIKRGRPKGSKNGPGRSSDVVLGASSTESTPNKKKKSKGTSDDSARPKKVKKSKLFNLENGGSSRDSPIPKKKVKELSGSGYDSSSNTSSSRSRGPVIHLEGPRESPHLVTVINAPTRLEEDEGNLAISKRKTPSHHNDIEYRGKVSRGGLFSSTLSARYDAHTTDPTWICVFCKMGPHSSTGQCSISNGDLFGPYLVTKEQPDENIWLEPSVDEKEITEEQKRGGKNKRSIRTAEMVEQFHQKLSKKAKRTQSADAVSMAGMVPVGKEEGCYEVWVHEDCAIWAAGVHLVGSRIVGLQEAVWGAIHTVCNKCGEGGASVGCVKRGCEWRLHFNCAVELGWNLDEEGYIAHCTKHKFQKKQRTKPIEKG